MNELTNRSAEPTKDQLKVLLNRYFRAGNNSQNQPTYLNWIPRSDSKEKSKHSKIQQN